MGIALDNTVPTTPIAVTCLITSTKTACRPFLYDLKCHVTSIQSNSRVHSSNMSRTQTIQLCNTRTSLLNTQIPRWLLFVRGVVDSDDLPLNVGREILQQSRSLRIIKQRLVKKSVEMMSDLAASNATTYNTFFKSFGKYIKVGIIDDEKSREDLIPLCRFFSSYSESDMTSLPDYVSRMPEDQKNIYYVVGETRAQASKSPALGKSSSFENLVKSFGLA